MATATNDPYAAWCRRAGGHCGIVLDEGVLFGTNEMAFGQTKRKLLDDCDLWCIVSLPGGVFTAAGAGVKINLLFFTRGAPTEKVWYYDLSHIKVGKKTPLTLAHFDDFFPNPNHVIIKVHDCKGRGKPPFWRAEITASDLHRFCLRLIQLLKKSVG